MPHRRATLLRQRVYEVSQQRRHPAHYLYARCAIESDLTEGQIEEILPRRYSNYYSQASRRIAHFTNLEPAATQAKQQVFDLVECLDGRRRIVDSR